MLYLASKSPRRRELLNRLGVQFEIIAVDIEEVWNGEESAEEYVSRLALDKARAGRKLAQNSWPVLASDTEVVLDGLILGKPENKDAAVSMLLSLSNRTHEVITAVAFLDQIEQVVISTNRVSFQILTPEECQAYGNTGESFDKAGAYAIQGKAAGFICGLAGSYSSVMGLPLSETAELLESIIQADPNP